MGAALTRAMGGPTRRTFLARLFAATGLALSYGVFGAYALAYLFPPAARRRAQRLFIGRRTDFAPGSARPFVDQRGRALLIVSEAGSLRAFDTRCPHLGCQVHWDAWCLGGTPLYSGGRRSGARKRVSVFVRGVHA